MPPHSVGSTDPIGDVIAWIPVVLAVVGMLIAFVTSGIVLILEALAKRQRVPPVEPRPQPEPRAA
jgi:hypothetical protein